MNTASIPALARATFKESMRDRLLLVVVVFALGLCLFSRVLGWLSIEDELKMLQDFSLTGISLLGLFLAMLVGAFSLARDVERRTAATLLTRAISRGEFILGKYLGLVASFWACLVGSALFLTVWMFLWGGSPQISLLAAVVGLLLECLLLTAVALFLGALSSPAVAAVGTFAFYLTAHSTEALRELVAGGKEPVLHGFYAMAYRLLPNLEDVNFVNGTTTGAPVMWGELGMGAVAVLCWTVVFLLAAVALFRRREL